MTIPTPRTPDELRRKRQAQARQARDGLDAFPYRIGLKLDAALYERLLAEADRKDVGVSALVREALRDFLGMEKEDGS